MEDELLRLTARVQPSHWWFRGRAEIVRRLVRVRLPPERGGTVVDVGCGTAATLGALVAEYRRVGIDASPTALELARRSCPEAEFARASLPGEAVRIPDDGDVYLLMDVLEHLHDDAEALAALWARMPAEAALVLTVPAAPELWSSHDEAHGHHRRYTRESLERLLRPFPGHIRLLSYFNSRLYPAIWLARKANRWTGGSLGAAGTDLHRVPEPLNRMLRGVFAGEADRLARALGRPEGKTRPVYRRGLSLVAVVDVARQADRRERSPEEGVGGSGSSAPRLRKR